jgi:hypothetical protein
VAENKQLIEELPKEAEKHWTHFLAVHAEQ